MHAAVVEMKDQRMDIHMPAASIWMTSCQTPCWDHPRIHAFSQEKHRKVLSETVCQPRVLVMVSKLRGTSKANCKVHVALPQIVCSLLYRASAGVSCVCRLCHVKKPPAAVLGGWPLVHRSPRCPITTIIDGKVIVVDL